MQHILENATTIAKTYRNKKALSVLRKRGMDIRDNKDFSFLLYANKAEIHGNMIDIHDVEIGDIFTIQLGGHYFRKDAEKFVALQETLQEDMNIIFTIAALLGPTSLDDQDRHLYVTNYRVVDHF